MIDALTDAKEELKRVDHLIFVSLKYTRTCDVLLNVVSRLVDSYEHAIDALIKYGEQKGTIIETPQTINAKTDAVLKNYEEATVKKNIETYILFRKILKAKYERINEYRRHVTLKTKIEGKDVEINIDNLTQYYEEMKEFLNHITSLVRQ